MLQVAGFTHTEADSSPDAAKAALDCIRDQIGSLEAEVRDLKLKVIIFFAFRFSLFVKFLPKKVMK